MKHLHSNRGVGWPWISIHPSIWPASITPNSIGINLNWILTDAETLDTDAETLNTQRHT